MQPGKVAYLEGLRGIAAMQVVLMHFVTGFMPRTAEHAWPPLRVVFDGHTAVYVFFLISGAVLTPSFARPGRFLGKLAKRLVRLGIPVAAAAAIATVLLALLPDAHSQASAMTGSTWLAMDLSGAPTLAHLAREIGLNSLLLGYRESTLFAPLSPHLPPMELSLDAPFWSLHLELYGSLLVLCLVTLRALSNVAHRVAVVAAAVAFATHPMFLFVLGHLLQPAQLSRHATGTSRGYWGVALLLLASPCASPRTGAGSSGSVKRSANPSLPAHPTCTSSKASSVRPHSTVAFCCARPSGHSWEAHYAAISGACRSASTCCTSPSCSPLSA